MDPASWTFTTAAADTTKPTLTNRTPAAGATGVPTTTTVTAVFDEAVTAAKAELRTAAGALVPATTAYTAATRTLTLTPSAALAASTTYTATVSEAADEAGNVMDPASWSFTTAAASANNCPCSIWAPSAVPDRTDPDRDSLELGVRFRAAQDGFITGIRFYKPSVSTGTHVGSLWTNTGTRLATVTFTNESASGWQQALFTSPVPVTANTTYVASYFAPSRYASSSRYFATAATTRGPLTALRDGTDGGNGVYRYGSTPSTFPTSTYTSENYWVDVVFQDADTSKPTLSSRTPAAGATGVPTTTTVTAVFDEAVTADTVKAELRTAAGALVPATTSYAAATRTVTLTPSAALAASTTYTTTVSEAVDAAGNVMDPASWSFTTAAADTTKPTLTDRTPAAGATGVPNTTTVTAVFDEAVTAAKAELRTAAGALVPATTGYAAATRTLTLTPRRRWPRRRRTPPPSARRSTGPGT